MRRSSTIGRSVLVLLSLTFAMALATDSSAATYVMVADEDMVDGAARVAVVRVLGSEVVEIDGRIFTDYHVESLQTYKGAARSGPLTLRRPGGILPDGRAMIVPGLPEMLVGQEALVFMVDRADGAYGFEHYLLGLFHLRTIEGRQVAYRYLDRPSLDLEDPRRQHRRASLEAAHRARDLEGFGSWIEDRAAGGERAGDYYLDEGFMQRHPLASFTNFDDGSGNNFHRHEFSPGQNGKTTISLGGKGLKGISQKGKKALKEALKPWTKVIGGKYKAKKKKTATGGLASTDGVHAWVFGDPNSEIAGSYSCVTGGVLAIGGFHGSTGPPHAPTGSGLARAAQAYWDITETDVVFQNGIECNFKGRKKKSRDKFIAEIGAHEIGHGHGQGHSCGDSASGPCNTNKKSIATMAAIIHDDGRGGKIKPDDLDGARALDYQGS